MTRRTLGIIGVIVVVGAVIALWPRQPDRAQQLAEQAASPEQARLWQEVAGRGTPPGLERLPVPRAPIEPRRQAVSTPSQAVTPGTASLAPGVTAGIRVVSSSVKPGTAFSARKAVVDEVSGDRVDADLMGEGRLSFVARIGSKPLAVVKGSSLQVAFESRPAVFARREILAVQTDAGALVASAFESGQKPITLSVGAPLEMTVIQDARASPTNGSLPVRIRIGKTEADMKPGDPPREIEGITVRLLGSVALPASGAADASPYAVDLIAWRQSARK